MSRIIDADNTVKTICGYYCGFERDECCSDDPCEAVAFIDAAPTISPDEVRGVGEWEDAKQHGLCRCSICKDCYIEKDYITQAKWRYCPSCGSKMRCKNEE